MRIPLTKYGWPQVVVYPLAVLMAMAILPLSTRTALCPWVIVTIEILLAAILLWSLSFFRDPQRRCPSDKNLLLAPADGQVTDIETVEEKNVIGGTALRIGIFLSIFSAHINRAPCNVKVEKITYRKGKYKNAMNPQSGRVNESNDLALLRTDHPKDKLLVRQISGSIARRIVCDASTGQELTGGEKFGMIKFGSRTELYVPVRSSSSATGPTSENDQMALKSNPANSTTKKTTQYAIRDTQYEIKCLVRIGDKVKAGLTVLVRYEKING